MADPIDFQAAKEARKPICLYCGGEPHATPLACPRIMHLDISQEGYVEGITFVDDWFYEEEEPDPAG